MGVLKVATPDGWRNVGCGGAAVASHTDDFNRADGALGSPWTFPDGYTFSISSSRAVYSGGTGSGEPIALYGNLSSEACDVAADLDPTAHPGCSLIWNYLSPGNFCMWNVTLGNSAAYKFTAGTPAVLRTFAVGSLPALGDAGRYRVTMTVAGDLTFYRNGVVGDAISITPHSGGYGVGVQGTVSQPNKNFIDNFAAADFPQITGRLKLWDGTQWVQEACDDSVGIRRPLYAWTGSAWDRVACMVPTTVESGTYDSATYDTDLYG